MPEHIRSLIVILFLSMVVFAFAKKPALALTTPGDFSRRRNLWFGLIALAFLSGNFWVYVIFSSLLLVASLKRESNIPALFLMLLFVLPVAYAKISGLGLVNYLFELSHLRVLSFSILLPAFFAIRSNRNAVQFGKLWPDKLLAAFLLMTALLYLRETSITDTARQSLYLFIDVFLPYYVISRSTKNLNHFRDTLTSFVIAAMLLSIIAIFESYKHWLLYNSLVGEMDLSGGVAGYLGRAESLRAVASTGQPIVLGYIIAVALGFYLYLRPALKGSLFPKMGLMLLLVGLISPLSRGPWVGTAVLLVVYIATGASALKRLVIVGLMAVMALPILAILPGGEKIVDLLPFVGSVDQANVDYREDLFRNSIIVIRKNLWLGSPNYMDSPEMQSMMQGQGIVDVVNTYIRITLESGLVGLGLYAGFFLVVLAGIRNGMKKVKDRNSEIYLLGRVLLATIFAIVVIIFSVSSITFIPIVYWSVTALGVAYSQFIKNYLITLKAADE